MFNRPGTVVVLDDDVDFLSMLSMTMPGQLHLSLFANPQLCIEHLRQESPFWDADAWNQQKIIANWREGMPLIPQVLSYWAKYTERWALSRALVVDYLMPPMNGLDVLAALAEWPGSRLLLTGMADEGLAIKAFNAGMIDQFIAKQADNFLDQVSTSVRRLLMTPPGRQASIWTATLSAVELDALRGTKIKRDLGKYSSWRWVEHVLLGDPFGVLGMDAEGTVEWLQLALPQHLHDLAASAKAAGFSDDEVTSIRSGRKLANLALTSHISGDISMQTSPTFPMGDGDLLGAVFEVPARFCPDKKNSYAQWVVRQEKPEIHGGN